MSTNDLKNTRNLLGLIFILFGVYFILKKTGVLGFELPFDLFGFSTILIIIGITIVISSRIKILGLLLIIFGLIFEFGFLWPILLVALGAYLIFNKPTARPVIELSKNIFADNTESGTFEDASIFGGGHKSYVMDNFTSGKSLSIFGGSEIDLRACKIEGEVATIELIAIFGGSTILIPRDWKIVNNVAAVLGGFSDSRIIGPDLHSPTGKTLIVKGVVILGGGEIKN